MFETLIPQNAAAAAYLKACEAASERQLDLSQGGVFAHLCLPLPDSTDQWEALKRWLDHLQERTRKFITIEFSAASNTASCAHS